MSPLPLPVRVAAGLVATAVEQARDLPRHVVEFPVTAVSQALQASMRVQQKVTDLAIKGDRALGALRPVEDEPSWATFDDEVAEPSGNGSNTVTKLRPQAARRAAEEPPAAPEPVVVDEEPPAVERPEAEPLEDRAVEVAAEVTAVAAEGVEPERTGAEDAAATGPNVLPGYRELTIPQLRGRLRHLDVEDLRALLEWETTHDNRAPFVTMLSNRITTVTEG
ncbi:lipid droplet-associated protein [Pseudonocardia nigra]|uniref:lipid droplet-associated protein n=1 Tax=Pseudonocardia nigra TaxID=1921578 RepID=UPI001C5EF5BE|nr:lipid droplet-associated protein [Pseudonocardia nigra]